MKANIPIYTVDELNNMSLKELNDLEDLVFKLFKRIKAVRVFTEEIDKEVK